ncbi:hypothetical protein EDC94DRAFT_582719 [Helicostylum pulchrum]|uniref:Uncharacterized protein n=1 Tax=Helicostylum pulchrum TaxID=562976 RepID=A0ABP9Y8B5_9FUNG|nr:hypothetical protein EDC94DRAFT_582719 [Helicostylum pulchrum]
MRTAIFTLAVPCVLAAAIIRPDSKAQSIVEEDNNTADMLQMGPNSVTDREEKVSSPQQHSIAASVSAVASISKQWSPVSYYVQSERETYNYHEYEADKADTYVVSSPVIPKAYMFTLPIKARPLVSKVEISVGDIYFSQTDSYLVPDLSSLPFIKNYPGFPI